MPKKIRLDWNKRVKIFRTFRSIRGNNSGTAKRHKVTRSTVGVIVKEFMQAGFADAPRLSLPKTIMAGLQEGHVQELLASAKDNKAASVGNPSEYPSRRRDAEVDNGLSLPVALGWHLKAQPVEEILSETGKALTEYESDCADLWNSVLRALEARCQLEAVDNKEIAEPRQDPALSTALADAVYEAMFLQTGFVLSDGWIEEPYSFADKYQGRGLRRLGRRMAVVRDTGLEDFLDQLRRFEAETMGGFVDDATRLTKVYEDLKYLVPIVDKALDGILIDDIGIGVCPSCPYPEAWIDDDSEA